VAIRPKPRGTAAQRAGASALDSMRRIVRALGISARTAERSIGITGAQLFVLRVLDAHPAQSLNELAALTFTHQSTVSVVVDRLVSRGFVTRSRSDTDGRRVVLALTAAGRRALRHAPPPTQLRLITAINALPPARRRELAKALKRVVGAMDLGGGTTGLPFDELESPRARRRR
jgi:MarR family transcriptional regulator, lower aerobic nicotinate degradation pathway regulator